ncbi:MAG: adenylate/guanylate cyclase domain-containing protein [Thiotrichaceae bacterium]|nr:adenylate/guanylate cyclase domain-containing protein [Thiotrichaceae bacterium]
MHPAKINSKQYLHSSRLQIILYEFFTNTAHFPIASILLEWLSEGNVILTEVSFYSLFIACIVQAYFLGNWKFQSRPHPFLGNLIAPTIYTAVEILEAGNLEFFTVSHHNAYWIFAFSIGLLQYLKLRSKSTPFVLNILENVIRVNILLVMYWIFEISYDPNLLTWTQFLADEAHLFLILTINFIGILIGIANYQSETYLALLQSTSNQLRLYSEWALGKRVLEQAMDDVSTLALNRQERIILFMDIRGFTQWSETQAPEKVVNMLNEYYETSEQCWINSDIIKVKFTADEIMIVFPKTKEAITTGFQLKQQAHILLSQYGLSAGIGIHGGLLVEGLVGGNTIKMFDVIGDTVNTAKRLCDNALGESILISEYIYELFPKLKVSNQQQIKVKGKADYLKVYSIISS